MSTGHHAFERLVAINPVVEIDDFAPSAADAAAFLRSIEEGSVDTKTKKLLKPLEPHPRRTWVAAVAGFAIVILVIGAVALWPAGGTDLAPATSVAPRPTPPPPTDSPTTSSPPSGALSPAQSAAIAGHVAAYNEGDLDAYLASFDSAVAFTFPDKGGPDVPFGRGSGTEFLGTLERWSQQKQWEMWLDATISVDDCADTGARVACSITYTDAFVARVMDRLVGRVELAIGADGRITAYHQDWEGSGDAYDQWAMSFNSWLQENHADAARSMAMNLGLDPLYTEESARLWNELSAEFLGVPSD